MAHPRVKPNRDAHILLDLTGVINYRRLKLLNDCTCNFIPLLLHIFDLFSNSSWNVTRTMSIQILHYYYYYRDYSIIFYAVATAISSGCTGGVVVLIPSGS